MLDGVAHFQPVVEVVAHVVTAERQHGERVATYDALRAESGCGGFRAERSGHVHAEIPVEGFIDQRHRGGAAAAEDEGRNRHALRVFPFLINRRALRSRRGKARIRVRRLAAGFLGDFRRPVLALPVDGVRRRVLGHAFPPHVAVVGQRDVGEDDVFLQGGHRVVVGLFVGARRNAEEAGFRVDRVELAVFAGFDPGDVITDCCDLPATEALRRDEHGKVGLAAGRRESGGDVGFFTFRRFDAEDQHVFGQPAFVARHVRGDAQREALLAEQRVAAVARAVGPDFAGFRVVHDVLGVRVARPARIFFVRADRCADRVHAGNELAVGAEHVEHGLAHARHGAHVDDDVRAIGDFDADVRDRRAERAHRERDDVHRAAAHAALENALQRLAHLGRVFPVVGRAGVIFFCRTDVGAVFNARHVRWVRPGEVGVLALFRIELDEHAGVDHFSAQAVVFFLRTIGPDDAGGFGQLGNVGHPLFQAFVFDVGGGVEGSGLVHGNTLSKGKVEKAGITVARRTAKDSRRT